MSGKAPSLGSTNRSEIEFYIVASEALATLAPAAGFEYQLVDPFQEGALANLNAEGWTVVCPIRRNRADYLLARRPKKGRR